MVLGGSGEIRELHVVATDAQADPRQLVRQIEGAVTQVGADIPDHRRISLVVLQPHRRARQAPRPRLTAIDHEGGRLSVQLEQAGTAWLGSLHVSGEPDPQDAARAALLAAEAFVSQEAQAELHTLRQMEVAGVGFYLAAIRLLYPDREETLLGTALLRADPLLSAARAVLDALNRHLGAA